MTAGLPGIGIGGIFYLLSAICMPLVELINTMRGKSNLKRWKTALTQFGLSCGMISGFWLMGIMLAEVLQTLQTHVLVVSSNKDNIFHFQSLWLSGSILFLVLGVMMLINWLIDLRINILLKIFPSIWRRRPRFKYVK